MGVEIEVKYAATREQMQALLDAFGDGSQRIRMATTYYDTPSGALSARKYTLRCRKENDISVCTLKTPAPRGARNEYEVEKADIRDALSELCRLSGIEDLPVLLAEGIEPVCGASFVRQAKQLTLEGAVVELAFDQGSLLGGFGRTLPLCEVEVELMSGDPSAVLAFAEKMAADYGLQPETRSKFYRAKLLSNGEL